jgi:hypothetical protein
MTEDEWLCCAHPEPLLHALRDGVSPRKGRLFALACCRRLWPLLDDEHGRPALGAAERCADGHLSVDDLWRAWTAGDMSDAVGGVFAATGLTGWRQVRDATDRVALIAKQHGTEVLEERAAQAVLFRDVFGNPFRPVVFGPEWRTSTVVALARQMYDTRDFSAMPILADALQDVGCDNEDVLLHCRGPNHHVRGCWVVDGLLQKV